MGICYGKQSCLRLIDTFRNPSEPIPIAVERLEFNTRKMSNHYTVNYPLHKKRTDSAIYRKTHHDLIHVKNLPCFICGKANINEKGESEHLHLETHHFYCEKAAQNAIDWEKFGEFATHCYNIQTGENIGHHYDWKKVAENPDIFVDSPHNMVVLCKEHHTSGNKGIHHVPMPEWILQKFPKDGFEFLV
jgi:hypothetical protein